MVNANKLLLGALLATAPLATYGVTISDIVNEVTVGSYSNYHINLFVSDGDSRGFTHNTGVREPAYQHDLARDYIASNFTAMGYDTWLDPFGFAYTNNITYTNCNNVVAVKPGMGGNDIIIIGAHYDTADLGNTDAPVTNACPGADDNGRACKYRERLHVPQHHLFYRLRRGGKGIGRFQPFCCNAYHSQPF